jgi:hypothetical protein
LENRGKAINKFLNPEGKQIGGDDVLDGISASRKVVEEQKEVCEKEPYKRKITRQVMKKTPKQKKLRKMIEKQERLKKLRKQPRY